MDQFNSVASNMLYKVVQAQKTPKGNVLAYVAPLQGGEKTKVWLNDFDDAQKACALPIDASSIIRGTMIHRSPFQFENKDMETVDVAEDTSMQVFEIVDRAEAFASL